MVLGDKAVKLDDSLILMFRNVGLSHGLAASGFNLTVVIAMTYFIARFLFRSLLLTNATCFLSMFGYVCLAGASASVMRAAVMCSMFLIIKATKLRPHVLSILGLALTMTIVGDPASILDVGLQLSYGATVGIVLTAKPLCACLSKKSKGIRYWFAETVAVVLASQAAVLPIQLCDFWQIGMMFVPANLFVTPVLAPVTVLGFASSVLIALGYYVPLASPLFSFPAQIIDWLSLIPLQMMRWVVALLASFDWAVMRIGTPSQPALVFYIVSWAALVFSLNLRILRPIAVLLYSLALAGMFWRPPLPAATVVCFPHAKLLVDCNRNATVVPSGSIDRKIERYVAQHGWHLRVSPSDQKQPRQNSAVPSLRN
jgi:competence protein ComEC